MSNFTTQLRYIIESITKDQVVTSLDDRINKACPLIFNFSYPIWNESYKPTLEKKILLRYFNKEIGLETYGLWKVYLQEKLNSIMPYYIELYNAQVGDYDLTLDSVTDKVSKSIKDTSTTSTDHIVNSVNNSQNSTQTNNLQTVTNVLNNDFPQSPHSGVTDYTSTSQNTTATDTGTIGNVTSGSTSNVTDSDGSGGIDEVIDFTDKTTGKVGSNVYLENIKKKRDLITNIDNMIVNELVDLFILLY